MRTNTIAALGAILSLLSAPLAAEERTLTFNSYLSPKAAVYKFVIKPWAEQVEAATEGRIKVVIPAATLAPPPRQWQLVESGVADVALVISDFENARLKLAQITRIPGLGGSAFANTMALWKTKQQFFGGTDEYKGVKMLAAWASAGNALQSGGDPMTTLVSVKGMKIRTQPGVEGQAVRAMGATPVDAPVTESFELISKGTIDGAVSNDAAAVVFNYHTYLKNITEFEGGLGAINWSLVMNERTWNSLSEQDQLAITKISENLIPIAGKAVDGEGAFMRGLIIKSGVKFHTPDADLAGSVAVMASKAAKDWVTTANALGVDGQAAIDSFAADVKAFDAK